jgi:aryl-alcohol dehydrogenase
MQAINQPPLIGEHRETFPLTSPLIGLLNGRTVRGIIQGDAVPRLFIPKLIDLYRSGRFPFDRLIRFYDFAEINEAVEDIKKGQTIKAVLKVSTP